MLSNRDEEVVSESIIVVKKLLQTRHKDYSDVIAHMVKLLDKVHVPMARASIVWLIGEYSDRVPKIAPDVLRKMAKTFTSEVCPWKSFILSQWKSYTKSFIFIHTKSRHLQRRLVLSFVKPITMQEAGTRCKNRKPSIPY